MNAKWCRFLLGGLSLLVSGFNSEAKIYYVNASNSVPVSPFTTWSTAAADIQSAINVANTGDEVLVANGVYETGGTALSGSNRVYVAKAILVQSVNGPANTVIQGYQVPGITNGISSIRCAYLVSGATLSGFTLTNGSSATGGGGGVYCSSSFSTISNCLILGNSCFTAGGGGNSGTYYNCAFSGNSSYGSGGGVASGALRTCQVSANFAALNGGGVYQAASLTNCSIFGNAASYGGGAYSSICTFNNCSIAGNYASSSGGGVYGGGALANCIVYYNTLGANRSENDIANTVNVSYSCTPATNGLGANNITAAPGFLNVDGGNLQLASWSSCIDAGNNAAVNGGTDLAGNPRIVNGTVDMGAFEFQEQFYPTIHYVSLAGAAPAVPYGSWASAATNIQDAIDAAAAGDFVLVSNGIYSVGGRAVYGFQTNRVVLNKSITVQALAGAQYTAIAGNPSYARCVYLTNGAVLLGFTLTNGGTIFSGENLTNENGGGAWCESSSAILSNCFFVANSAQNFGGGSYSGTLLNCFFKGNSSQHAGGASFGSSLTSCTLSNNFANLGVLTSRGGGACGGVLSNCLLIANYAPCGGGACSNVLCNCTLITNRATKTGGGTYFSILTNCFLSLNLATNGGGAAYGTLVNCTLTNNFAGNGGGACSNYLVNCLLMNNTAFTNGGGAWYANLVDCTLSGNSATNYGGGAFYSNLTNCFVAMNSALYGAGLTGGTGSGCLVSNNIAVAFPGGVTSNTMLKSIVISNSPGGSYACTLNQCSIIGNIFGGSDSDILNNCLVVLNTVGDGAYESVLNNCTVRNNFAGGPSFSGARDCNATNCIIYYNIGGNVKYDGLSLNIPSSQNCCTTPLVSGSGNFTNAPLFVDAIHLASNSPCIDAGASIAAPGNVDFDGRPRIVGSAVDVGATEFQGVAIEPFISWLYQYGLPDDGSADYSDSDGTGMNNWQKWIAGLNPTNSLSLLKMSSVLTNSHPGLVITWQSVTNVTYYLQRSRNLLTFSSIQSNLLGLAGTTSFTDSSATNYGSYFYRVAVQQ